MPLVIHPRIRKAIGRVAAMTCVAVCASTGAAFASTGPAFLSSCQTQSVSTPFAQFGDANRYFLVPGGSFEGSQGQVGWSLSNAELTAGNEPYYVNGASDDQSLTINGGGSATSPSFCGDNTMPYLRFFARETAPGSDLDVQAVFRLEHHEVIWPLAVISDGSMNSWAPAIQIGLGLRLLPSRLHVSVQVRLVAPGAGSWQVDDVYVDPFRLG